MFLFLNLSGDEMNFTAWILIAGGIVLSALSLILAFSNDYDWDLVHRYSQACVYRGGVILRGYENPEHPDWLFCIKAESIVIDVSKL